MGGGGRKHHPATNSPGGGGGEEMFGTHEVTSLGYKVVVIQLEDLRGDRLEHCLATLVNKKEGWENTQELIAYDKQHMGRLCKELYIIIKSITIHKKEKGSVFVMQSCRSITFNFKINRLCCR